MTNSNAQTVSSDSMKPKFVNGVNTNVLKETVGEIMNDSELGKCHFRASNKWVDGAHNRSTVTGFYGAKQEIAHKQPFTLLADEPAILAGNDDGANPVEHLLHALASCITTSMVAHAAVRGIEIEELESILEGDIDLNGFLGLDENVPKGYTQIRANFNIKAKEEDLETIKSLGLFSPVLNTLTNGVPVEISLTSI